MNPSEQTTAASNRKTFFSTPLGAMAGALLGAFIGFSLSKTLSLGERLQQMNMTNIGSSPMLVKLDTKRFNGDGEVLVEAGNRVLRYLRFRVRATGCAVVAELRIRSGNA
jgi:hypothetical protein